MYAALLIVAAYFCGSLPTGVWLARRAGVDVRRSGSGNIGATNVARTAGLRLAVLTLAGDVIKGFVPAMLARATLANPWLIATVGLAAFCGHIFSIFLRFSGGKGVATALGVFLALAPAAAAVCVIVFALTARLTRYVSVASLAGAAALPAATLLWADAPATSAAALIAAGVILFTHRSNLTRLRQGTEPTFGIRQ
jgi:acyl phosphate:glycerol-3-phosphate acyltransferase